MGRLRAGLSTQQVADRIKRSRRKYESWEAGRSVPDALEVGALAVVLGCTADYLVLGLRAVPAGPPPMDAAARERQAAYQAGFEVGRRLRLVGVSSD